jgi:hypothetical protein
MLYYTTSFTVSGHNWLLYRYNILRLISGYPTDTALIFSSNVTWLINLTSPQWWQNLRYSYFEFYFSQIINRNTNISINIHKFRNVTRQVRIWKRPTHMKFTFMNKFNNNKTEIEDKLAVIGFRRIPLHKKKLHCQLRKIRCQHLEIILAYNDNWNLRSKETGSKPIAFHLSVYSLWTPHVQKL